MNLRDIQRTTFRKNEILFKFKSEIEIHTNYKRIYYFKLSFLIIKLTGLKSISQIPKFHDIQ